LEGEGGGRVIRVTRLELEHSVASRLYGSLVVCGFGLDDILFNWVIGYVVEFGVGRRNINEKLGATFLFGGIW